MNNTNKIYVKAANDLTFSFMQSIDKALPMGAKTQIVSKTGLKASRVTEVFSSMPKRGFKAKHLNVANCALEILEQSGFDVKKLLKSLSA